MADEDGDVAAIGAGAWLETAIPDATAEALVDEAVRRREEQQSGRSMGRQLRRVAGGVGAGLVLIAVGGLLRFRGQVEEVASTVAIVAGVLIIAVAGLILLRALDLSSVTQWGEPVGEPCPSCGQRGLREDRVAVPGARGIVALCTPECDYADVRPDPESSPQP